MNHGKWLNREGLTAAPGSSALAAPNHSPPAAPNHSRRPALATRPGTTRCGRWALGFLRPGLGGLGGRPRGIAQLHRAQEDEWRRALDWMKRHSLSASALNEADAPRRALDALRGMLDGQTAVYGASCATSALSRAGSRAYGPGPWRVSPPRFHPRRPADAARLDPRRSNSACIPLAAGTHAVLGAVDESRDGRLAGRRRAGRRRCRAGGCRSLGRTGLADSSGGDVEVGAVVDGAVVGRGRLLAGAEWRAFPIPLWVPGRGRPLSVERAPSPPGIPPGVHGVMVMSIPPGVHRS